MKFTLVVALAASVPSLFGTVGAAPSSAASTSKDSAVAKRDALLVTGLGGVSFRINQVENQGFVGGSARGPLALARGYTKWGQQIPPELLLIIQAILRHLGIILPGQPGRGVGGRPGSKPIGRPMQPGRPTEPRPERPTEPRPERPTEPRPERPTEPRPGRPTNGTLPVNGTQPLDPGLQDEDISAGEVAAVPAQFDSQYLCEVQIGTPPQTLTLNFDTGSSDLWVFSSETPQQLVTSHSIYDIAASSTAKRVEGASWNISYGDGSTSSGNVYTDVVSIGGITVQNQAIESATQVSASFARNGNQDGLVGLAFGSINTVKPAKQKTFFENAVEELAMPLFTANLKNGTAGNYNFGVIDDTEFTGDITFTNVNNTIGHWLFNVDSFSIGGVESGLGSHGAIADTGTSLMLVPDDILQAYYSKVEGAQFDRTAMGYVVPCNAELPDYTAKIGDFEAVVPGEFIKYAPLDAETQGEATKCFGGIQTVGKIPFAIYGDVFLKAFFVVFHQQNSQLGFANKQL